MVLRVLYSETLEKNGTTVLHPICGIVMCGKHFNEVFLGEQNLSFIDFFNKIDENTPPSECVIYGEYLFKTKLIEILPIEGFLKFITIKSNIYWKRSFIIFIN